MKQSRSGAPTQKEGQQDLRAGVMQNDLCTGCGACVNLCPYFEHHRDSTVILHACDGSGGRCFSYCPRTPTRLDTLQNQLFDPADLTPELGAVKGLYMTRASDPAIRRVAQHGGTVTALMSLALAEGIINTAVVADQRDDLLPESTAASTGEGVSACGNSKFVVSPTVARFNQVAKGTSGAVGLVATPCQALALAKMRCRPAGEDQEKIGKLKLVIGLFCGWALSWAGLKPLLDRRLDGAKILKLDIPPSKHQTMEVTTETGVVEIPLADIEPHVRDNCDYCFDMTCEFADLSVGSARSTEGWAVDKGWNQVIVRTEQGRRLLDLARDRGILEYREVPAGNLEKLKSASMNKKKKCIQQLVEKSGRTDDLIYLSNEDPAVRHIRNASR